MEADIESMDLDEANKMAMEELLEERQEAIMEDVEVEGGEIARVDIPIYQQPGRSSCILKK